MVAPAAPICWTAIRLYTQSRFEAGKYEKEETTKHKKEHEIRKKIKRIIKIKRKEEDNNNMKLK